MWDQRYRQLQYGEIIQPTDEVYNDTTDSWETVKHSIGQKAPDPGYTSHRMIRRYVGWHRWIWMKLKIAYYTLR